MGRFRTLFRAIAAALLILVSGCRTLEKAILHSKSGGNALAKAKYSIRWYYRDEFTIHETGDFRIDETPRGEKAVLLLHGFGSGDGIWGKLEDPYSALSLAHGIFDGRVLVANYPSGVSLRRISEELILEMERIRTICGGRLPDIVVLAHSMGGIVARTIARERPEFFREIALLSVPNTGLRFGILTDFIFDNYTKYFAELLSIRGFTLPADEDGSLYSSIDDLRPTGDFLKDLNTPTEPLNVAYHFFVLKSTTSHNPFIPGKDDSLISPGSAYPRAFARKGKFEDVRVRSVVYLKGDVNHHTVMFNPEIMRLILLTLRNGSEDGAAPDGRSGAVRVSIPRADSHETDYRSRIFEDAYASR